MKGSWGAPPRPIALVPPHQCPLVSYWCAPVMYLLEARRQRWKAGIHGCVQLAAEDIFRAISCPAPPLSSGISLIWSSLPVLIQLQYCRGSCSQLPEEEWDSDSSRALPCAALCAPRLLEGSQCPVFPRCFQAAIMIHQSNWLLSSNPPKSQGNSARSR